ncbi:MAG: beta-phosphoglucomutase [Paraglaciecola sp.]|jgi:beta-phosphoglucomutase
MTIKACLFDLDGVIVDTAKYHFAAWRRMANKLGFDFTHEENEKLKGVSRMDSLALILKWGGVEKTHEEQLQLSTQKNDWYVESIANMQADEVLEGIPEFLAELKGKGIRIGLGSASRNAPRILEAVGLMSYFETLIDGSKTTKGKPDPQVFQMGAEELGVKPSETIVFEDAPKGVDAALAGGFYAVGIGEEANLGHAHYVMPGFVGLSLEMLEKQLTV